MRRRRTLAIGIALACALAGLAVSTASAQVLVLTEAEGVAVPRGAIAVDEDTTFTSAGSCLEESLGSVRRNERETDRLTFEPPLHIECTGEESVSGGVSTVRLGSDGLMRLRMNPRMVITIPGPCVYELKSLEGGLGFPDIAYITGEAIAKRNKRASAATCAKTTTIAFAAGEYGPEAAYVFGTELVG